MAKYSNTVEYNIRTTLDSSGIAKLQTELAQLQNRIGQIGATHLMDDKAVQGSIAKIEKIRNALNSAFNPKLGMFNSSTFFKNVGMSMNEMYQTFNKLGPAGQRAFTSMYGQIAKIDTGMRSVSSTTDKIMNTLGNTVRWGLIASGFSQIMNAAHQAVEYTKELDKSLTDIMMVSGESRDRMNEFAREANEVAKRLGGTTVQMTEATKVFIQQGLSLKESSAMGEYAVHLANVSGQESSTASDEITAYRNAFKIDLEDMGNAISKWAAVANNAAVSVEELSIASQKAASVAATVGVDLDQFAGHIAAIESVTREAPENIGNGLKTIYSRIADISLGETLEDGVNLGSFAKALEKVGVDVLDQTGKLRDAGIILEDLMGVWQELDTTQRAAVAKTVAGRFQLARFEALMNRADIYEKAANTSRAETGTETYDRMQETYRDSMEGRMNALQASVEEIFLNLFSTDNFYPAIDALQSFVDTINNLIEATGDGSTALLGIANILLMISKNSIARGISNVITNTQANMQANENIRSAQSLAQNQLARQGLSVSDERTKNFANDIASVNQYAGIMNEEQIRNTNSLIQERTEVELQLSSIVEKRQKLENGLKAMIAGTGEATEGTVAQLVQLGEQLQRDGVEITKDKQAYKDMQAQLTSTAQIFTEFINGLKNTEQNMEVTKEQAGKLSKYFKALGETGIFVGEQVEMLDKAILALNEIEKSGIDETKGAVEVFERFGVTLEFVNEALAIAPEKFEQLVLGLQQARTEEIAAGEAAQILTERMQFMSHGLQIQSMAKGVASLGNALMSVVFTVQSFQGLMEILNDETKSPFEKLQAGAMDFAMVLAMGAPLIIGMINSIKKMTTTVTALRLAETESVATEMAKNISTEVNTKLTKDQIKEKIKQAAVEGTLTEEQIAQLSAETGLSAAKIMDIAATEGLTVAMGELGAAVWTALAPMIPFIAAATAIGLVVAGIVFSVMDAEAKFHEFDNIVEQTGKQLDEANEYLKETKENLTNVKDALDKIKSSDDAFDGLVEGTIEWNEALFEANQQVRELIDKYPELAEYTSIGKNGQLTLTKKGQELAAQYAQQEMAAAEIQKSYAQNNYNAAKSNQSALNTARSNFSKAVHENTSVETYGWGESVSVKTNTDNQAIADTMKTMAAEYATAMQDSTNQSLEAFESKYKEYLSEDEAVKASQLQALADLTKAENDNTLALRAENKANAGSLLSSNKFYQDADANTKEVLQNLVADDLDKNSQLYKDTAAEINSLYKTEEEKQQAYAQMRNFVVGKDGKYYASQEKLESGEEIKWDNIDIDDALISQAIAKSITDNSNQFIDPIKNLNEDQIQALKDYQNNTKMLIDGKMQGFADYLSGQGITSVEGFIEALNNGTDFINEAMNPMDDSHSLSDLEYDYEKTAQNPLDQETHDAKLEQFTNEEAEKWDIEVEDIVDQAEALQDILESVDEDFELTEGRARALAIQNQRMAKGLDTLTENWEDWSDALQDVNKGSKDYIDAAQDLTKCIADLVGAEEDLDLSKEFFDSAENMEYLAQAAEGDIDAVNRLGVAVAQDLVSQMEPLKEFSGLDFSDADTEQAWGNMVNSFNQAKDTVISGLENLQQNLDNIGFGENIYDQLGGAEWVSALNEMAKATGMSVEQMNSLLNSMGVQADVTTTDVDQDVQVPEYETIETVETLEEPDKETGRPGRYRKTSRTQYMGSKTVPGKVPVAQINTGDGVGTPPSINYVGNGGSPRPSSSGSGGKGGGGGGGGSKGKTNEPKAVKRTEEADSEFDIYNKVNDKLSRNEDLLTKIDKRKSRLSGSRYRDTLAKENTALKEQNKILTERNKIANAKADALRTGKDNPAYGIYLKGESLAKYGLKDSDNNGTIDNYKAVYNRAYSAQKAAQKAADDYFKAHGGTFDKYGNTTKEASMTEEESKKYTELVEKAKQRADYANAMKKVVDDYQGTMDQIRDDTQKIQDNMDKIQDNIIEVWKYARKAGQEFGDMKDDITDTKENLATMWGDDPTKSLGFAQERFTNLFESDTKLINDRIKELRAQYAKETDKEQKAWLKEQIELAKKARDNGTSVLDLNMQNLDEVMKAYDEWKKTGKSKLFGNNEQAMFEALDDAFKDGVEYAEEIKDRIEGIRDAISDVMDEIYDGLEDRLDQFDQINDAYEHIRDMSELIYGDQAYATQAKMFNAEAQAGENRLQTLEKAREENHKMLESLEEGSEEYKKALEKERELDQDILSTRKDIVQAYKDAKEAANNLAVQNWQDNFTTTINGVDGIPLQYAADQWERIKENADLYLDDLNRAWELEKLQNEYQKLLNDATDPKIQQQITQQMEQQLGYLRDKTNLSKYDVEYANAQLEILQKTIALEDARNAKNKMKLRRDSQGNYEYVYTADQNATKDAENELLDAQMNGYNISVAASREATDNYFQKIQDMADKLRDVANDATLSAEQVEAITQDIIKSGYDFLDANAKQLNTAQINAVESFIKAAQNLAEENATRVNAINQELIEGTNTNADLMTTVLHSAVQDWIGPDGLALFRESAEQTKQDIKRNIEEFVDSVSEANTNVSVPLNDLQYQFDTTTDSLNDLNSSAHDFYNFLEDKSGIVREAANDLAYYQKKMTDMNNKMNAYYRSWNEMSKQLESQKAINSQLQAQLEGKTNKGKGRGNSNGSGSGSGSGSGGNGSNSGKSRAGQTPTWDDIMSGARIKYVSGDYLNSSYGDRSSTGHIGLGGEVFVLHTNQGAPYPVSIENGTYQLGWVALNQLELMKSGGYTGEWGEEGKIAMLHQKELVLNAADTENMLAAVGVVREIVNSLKGINSGANLATLGRVNSSMPGNNVEQRVEIKAEFPNVQSSTEIENALISLSNDAYIYAQDKNETFI